jgi:hypothetical protein
MATDGHWAEVLRCPRCKNTGTPEITELGGSFDIKVDLVPEGFTIFESEHGINFDCSSCDCPAEL